MLSGVLARISGVVTVEDVRRIAAALPRTEEALVGDRVKFRVGRLVYLALSRDETLMGFAFPKEERVALVAAEPDKFLMPIRSDERYNWVRVRLAAIEPMSWPSWCSTPGGCASPSPSPRIAPRLTSTLSWTSSSGPRRSSGCRAGATP